MDPEEESPLSVSFNICSMHPETPINNTQSADAIIRLFWYRSVSFFPNNNPITPPAMIATTFMIVPSPNISVLHSRVLSDRLPASFLLSVSCHIIST